MKKLLLLSLIFINACASADLRIQKGEGMANRAGFLKDQVQTDFFKINTYSKILAPTGEANIYIEGDGFAVANRGRLSVNPTPRKPVALELAILDKSKNVIYIARPCQYVEIGEDEKCEKKYWSSHRFAPEAVDSISQAIDKIKADYSIKKVNLIGFSGGGGIAAILSAKRDDVKTLRTVAGNLDHVEVNAYHRVEQMPESLNAIDYAKKSSNLPQHHYIGDDDRVVPENVAQKFVEHVEDNSKCASVISLENISHLNGWEKVWNSLVKKPVKCNE